jgi:hypothetical protein
MRSNEPVVASADVLQVRFVMKNEFGEDVRCCVPYSALDTLEHGSAKPGSVFDKHRDAIEALASDKHTRGEGYDGRVALGTDDVVSILHTPSTFG